MSCKNCNHWYGRIFGANGLITFKHCYKFGYLTSEDRTCRFDTTNLPKPHDYAKNKSEKFI